MYLHMLCTADELTLLWRSQCFHTNEKLTKNIHNIVIFKLIDNTEIYFLKIYENYLEFSWNFHGIFIAYRGVATLMLLYLRGVLP